MMRSFLTCFLSICALIFLALYPAETLLAQSIINDDANPIVINEFMATNSSTLADEDGDSSDWIEIYNSDNSPVNLQGYGLSDNSAGADKWLFPNVTLNAGEFLTVFASNKDRSVAGNELHTNFKLSASGEYLGLFVPNGTVVHAYAPVYPSQFTDVSYGIDGNGDPVFFSDPTPNASNSDSTIPAAVTFSVAHGFYNSPQSVALVSATPNVTIRYTVDSSEPTITSAIYTQPLSVSSSTIIRARAFANTGVASNIATQTYLFMADILAQDSVPPAGWPTVPVNTQVFDYGFTPSIVAANPTAISNSLLSIPSISLVTDMDNLFASETGIYVNAAVRGRDGERPGSIELIDPTGAESGFSVNTGIRIRGRSSRNPQNPKHSFRFIFRSEYGDSQLNYPVFGEDRATQFKKLDLRTAQAFSWAWSPWESHSGTQNTMVREIWNGDTQGAMGTLTTASDYYHLYINGQYWGVYQTEERISEEFGVTYLGGDEEDYDVLKNSHSLTTEVTSGNDAGWLSLWTMVEDQIVTDSEYATISEQVDLENLAVNYILYFFSGDLDGAPALPTDFTRPNNWYAMRNRVDGKWIFFDHDSEFTLCTRTDRFENDGINDDVTGPWPDMIPEYEYFHPGWLHQALLSNDNYHQLFQDLVQLHLLDPNGALRPAANIARFNERVAQLAPAIDAYAARWGDSVSDQPPRTKATWDAEIDFVVNTCLAQRNAVVEAQLATDGLMPTLSPPTAAQVGGAVAYGASISLSHANGAGTIYYTTDGSDPRGLDDLPTATAINGTSPSLTDYQTTVTARVRDGGEWSAPFVADYLVNSSPHPTSLVVNEYNAVDKDDGAWTGSDPLFTGDPRNGGDWIEFAIVKDVDLRGWSVELWDRDRGSDALKLTDKFTFSNAPMLANLEAGTLFTISEDQAEDLTYDVRNNWDWSFNIQASNETTSALLTAESNINFDVNHKDFRIVIRNANGDIVSPVAMGETELWDAANGNVSPSEIMALCVPPTVETDAVADYRDEKTNSTFGEPNICNGVAQDLTALRGKLGDVNCDGLVNVIDALFIMQTEVRLRTDVGNCPLSEPATMMNGDSGNVNRDSAVNVIDALLIIQCEARIVNAFCPE